jgi:hypothetical protein
MVVLPIYNDRDIIWTIGIRKIGIDVAAMMTAT